MILLQFAAQFRYVRSSRRLREMRWNLSVGIFCLLFFFHKFSKLIKILWYANAKISVDCSQSAVYSE